MPPPRAKPPTPVLDTSPPVVASPCCWVAASKSFHSVPPPATARRPATSTCTELISARSTTIPSSQVENPATLCEPPRTAIGSPSLRANRTVRTTSSVDLGRTTSAGCLSCTAFQTLRASSYCGSCGRITVPEIALSSSLTEESPRTWVICFLLVGSSPPQPRNADFEGSLRGHDPLLIAQGKQDIVRISGSHPRRRPVAEVTQQVRLQEPQPSVRPLPARLLRMGHRALE